MSAMKHSEERLKRLAMASGGRIDISGVSTNPSRTVAELRKPTPPKVEEPKPAPKADPVIVQSPDFAPVMEMAAATKQAAEAQVRIADEIAKSLAKELPQINPERVKRWVFTVNRDQRGLITTIEANAK